MTRSLEWKRCVEFHGHECPGLAYGVRACQIAMARLGVERAADEELVAVVECDACGADAVQVLTGCTLGKGNLILKNRGKQAFTFIQRSSQRAVRILMLSGVKRDLVRQERIDYILNAPEDSVAVVKEFAVESIPERARIFGSVRCQQCGEECAEPFARIQQGQIVCLDCYDQYSRGW